jgi:hypothetical protein
VAYSARAPGGGAYSFGTSGLLYRSNKLMYDRQTSTLWSTLTGEPVVDAWPAPAATADAAGVAHELEGVATAAPDTTALKLDAAYGAAGADYRPGAADRARAGVSFPVGQKSGALPERTEVFGLRIGAAARAYPLQALSRAGVVNDVVGGRAVVLVADAAGAVRAYERGARTFARAPDASALIDEGGRTWRVEEEARQLRPAARGPAAAGSPARPRGLLVRLVRAFLHTEVWAPLASTSTDALERTVSEP